MTDFLSKKNNCGSGFCCNTWETGLFGMVRGWRTKKKATSRFLSAIDTGSDGRPQMTSVLSKKKHCGSGFCGKRLDSSLYRPGYLVAQLIIRSSRLRIGSPCVSISVLAKLALIGSSRTGSFGANSPSVGVATMRTSPATPTKPTQMSKKHSCVPGFCSMRRTTACRQCSVRVPSSIYR